MGGKKMRLSPIYKRAEDEGDVDPGWYVVVYDSYDPEVHKDGVTVAYVTTTYLHHRPGMVRVIG